MSFLVTSALITKSGMHSLNLLIIQHSHIYRIEKCLREHMLIETVNRRTTMSDYLAIINGGAGIGSWARSEDKQKAIDNVIRIFRSDWKSILKPKDKSPTIKGIVYDVEGYNEVVWDDRFMWGDGKKIEPKHEIFEHTYAKWK